eukprot:TRINITY_DN7597_c0_g1_i1.p1 TRINITY_DN7597_c0_g1~~TRINITY_DN7597_c0_g1_i1.p1  ORF type:complete len:181 (+),score=52.47 TRINITY_DN7597_c0_g1_i1:81-623(+)
MCIIDSFNMDTDLCKLRVTQRRDHPTIPFGRGQAIVEGTAKKMEPPAACEKFGVVHTLRSTQDAVRLLEGWGAAPPALTPDQVCSELLCQVALLVQPGELRQRFHTCCLRAMHTLGAEDDPLTQAAALAALVARNLCETQDLTRITEHLTAQVAAVQLEAAVERLESSDQGGEVLATLWV